MKRFFLFVLAVCSLLPCTVSAQQVGETFVYKNLTYRVDVDTYGFLTGTAGKKYATLISVPADMRYIKIPGVVDYSNKVSFVVYVIADHVCQGSSPIDSISISSNIRSISPQAFEGQTINTVILYNTEEKLIAYAPLEWPSEHWRTINKPSDAPFYNVTVFNFKLRGDFIYDAYVPEYLFAGNTSLYSVNIETDNIRAIGKGAFDGCTNLHTLTLPDYTELATIGDYAFRNCSNLVSPIILPFNMRYYSSDFATIGASAFEGCANTPSLTVGNAEYMREYSIGANAFKNCTNIQRVTLSGVPTSISSDAFTGCVRVRTLVLALSKDVNFTDANNNSPLYAFLNLNRLEFGTDDEPDQTNPLVLHEKTYRGNYLETVWIKHNVADVEMNALTTAYDLSTTIKNVMWDVEGTNFRQYTDCPFGTNVENVIFGYKVKEIPARLFKGSKLETLVLPYNVETVGAEAFAENPLESVVLSQNLKTIQMSAFENTQLTSVTIPSSLEQIDMAAFKTTTLTKVNWNATNCVSNVTSVSPFSQQIREISFGNTVQAIPGGLLIDQSHVTHISLPASLQSIGANAFKRCSGLRSIYCNGTVPPTVGAGAFNNISEECIIHVPSSAYFSANVWKDLPNKNYYGATPQGYFGVNNNMQWKVLLNYMNYATILEISGTDEWPGDFYDNEPWKEYKPYIEGIVIGDGVQEVPRYAFYNCSAAKAVSVGKDVIEMEFGAFEDCSSLYAVQWNATNYPVGMTENYWPFAMDDNGEFAAQFTEFRIGDQVQTLPNGLCANMKNLSSITIPASVTAIGTAAFTNCTGLREMIVEPANQNFSMMDGVLMNKNKTRLVAYPAAAERDTFLIPDGITSFGEAAFAYNQYLTHVSLPEGVTNLPNGLFGACERLKSVVLPSTVQSLEAGVFNECNNLVSVTCYAEEPPVLNDEFRWGGNFEFETLSEATLFVPAGSLEAYQNVQPTSPYFETWSDFGGIAPIGGAVVIPAEEEEQQGIETVESSIQPKATNKFLRDGQFYILRGEKIYSITGQEVK